jgi:transposase
MELKHTPEAIDHWVSDLRQRYEGRPVAVCFEQTHGPIAYALLKYDFITLFPLPPARLTKYRESFTSSGAKDDPTDAALLLDYLMRHPDRLRAWNPDDPQTRELRILTEARRAAVDQRTAMTNQLTAALKLYFPQALDLAGDLTTPMACDFLSKWPTLEAVKKSAPHTLRKFYYSHNSRSESRIAERLDLVKSALPLTDDQALVSSGTLKVRCLVGQLRALFKSIQEYEARIRQLMDQHADAALFRGLPGAGDALAPRLVAAFGSDRDRFESAEELQSLSGVAPVTKRSGKRKNVHRRWACPKFLLQTFHEFANCSTKQCAWADAYYNQQRDAGKAHHSAVRALAFKWVRILFRCWKTRTPYSDEKYLASLQRNNAPLLKFLDATATS